MIHWRGSWVRAREEEEVGALLGHVLVARALSASSLSILFTPSPPSHTWVLFSKPVRPCARLVARVIRHDAGLRLACGFPVWQAAI